MEIKLNNCTCGQQPAFVMISKWPAQYLVKCECGISALGAYYGSDDEKYRHSEAQKAALKKWNTGSFKPKEEECPTQ